MQITHKGTARICEFAFQLAGQRAATKGRAGRVTNVDKANVFASMALWRQIFETTATRHPDVAADSAYVDAMALNLVMKPWTFDVMVTENMFGDILSDLIAALVGGMGMATSTACFNPRMARHLTLLARARRTPPRCCCRWR